MPLIEQTQETELALNHKRSLSKINPELDSIPTDLARPTEYYVGLYSVNKRRMADSPYAFVVENGAYKTVGILACPADQRYVKVRDIPHPVQWIEMDPHQYPGGVVLRTANAGQVAMSIVHPDIIGTKMDHLPAQSALDKYAISSNCDLLKQGVFFTRADEGSPEFEKALEAAEARRDAYYQKSLDGLLGMSEDQIRQVLNSEKGLDLRTASIHFGVDIPGIRSRTVKADCPNCFEKIPTGAAFHRNELLGVICVIDWKRAVEAGVKTKDDVPDSKRWWIEFPRGAPLSEAPGMPHGVGSAVSEEEALMINQANADAEEQAVKRGRGRPPGSKTQRG